MDKQFNVLFLEEAFNYLSALDRKHYEKILYNIRKSQIHKDPSLFKKITADIWEFRTLYEGIQHRMLAFWDKSDSTNTLVVATHGFVKKQNKVPEIELLKTIRARNQYFHEKQKAPQK